MFYVSGMCKETDKYQNNTLALFFGEVYAIDLEQDRETSSFL